LFTLPPPLYGDYTTKFYKKGLNMNQLTVIKGVECFIGQDGIVQLKLEHVARGLGFTETKDGKEYVMWRRVKGYISDFGFGTSAENDYISEPIFYLLAMKANNDTAKQFQKTVAYEILPSIRKHGLYATEELLNDPELAIKAFTALKEERERRKELEQENKILIGAALEWANKNVLNAIIRALGAKMGFEEAWRDFKKELLYNHGININQRVTVHMNQTGKKTKPATLSFIHDEEMSKCVSTAVALCKSKRVDISEIIKKFNKTA
jgi:prophage antirepressor-like protein